MRYNEYERENMRTFVLADDDIVIRRDAGNEQDSEHTFFWENFRLFDSSRKEIDLDTDIFSGK